MLPLSVFIRYGMCIASLLRSIDSASSCGACFAVATVAAADGPRSSGGSDPGMPHLCWVGLSEQMLPVFIRHSMQLPVLGRVARPRSIVQKIQIPFSVLYTIYTIHYTLYTIYYIIFIIYYIL